MDDLQIKAFEQKIVDTCNGIQISNRAKYYVLRDIADKLLEASERDIAISLAILDKEKKQKGGGE